LTLAAFGVFLLVAGCGDDGGDDSRQLNLIAVENQVTEIDTGKNGPSEGDVNVFDTPLTFADEGGKAGHLYGIQTTVSLDDQTEIVQASFTFKLAEGTISIGGLGEYPRGDNSLTRGQEFERPIVGGTGSYSGAAGTDTTILNSDGQYEHELRLEE
jgi:hypothetical protein